MQVRQRRAATCAPWWSASSPGSPGEPRRILVAGRHITRSHYEAVADIATGFGLGDRIRIRRHDYTVVGLTRRMVSSGGDPMVFIPLKDAQEAQFLKDNDAILQRAARAPRPIRPSTGPACPACWRRCRPRRASNRSVNAVLVQVQPGYAPKTVAEPIRRWKHLQAYTRAQMEEILVAKLIATSARQIGMFLVILAVVSAAIVAFIIYTMTLGKIREIAVLKLIGTRNRTIAGMILQQALGLGLIGFVVGKIAATFWAPIFPKYVLLEPRRRRARVLRGDGDLRAGQHAGHPRGAARSIRPRRSEAEHETTLGIRIEGLRKRYGSGDTAVDALEGRRHGRGARRGGGPDRAFGLGQEHLAQVPGRGDRAHRRPHGAGRPVDLRRRLEDPRPARAAARQHRLRVPGAVPDPVPRRHRQRRLAADAGRRPNAEARQRALELLTALDVAHRASAMPSQLSGGEQQRVSIARALANRPPVILADEPTAPLDSERALAVMRILNQMAAQYHTAIIVVTHDEKIIPTFKRIYHIRDGATYEEAGEGRALPPGLWRPLYRVAIHRRGACGKHPVNAMEPRTPGYGACISVWDYQGRTLTLLRRCGAAFFICSGQASAANWILDGGNRRGTLRQ